MQYKVPQNVDIEDKVIAGLTLRQFGFLMGAGGTVLALKFLLPETLSFLFMPLALVIGIFGLALAFYKINDRPFEIFLISAAKTLLTPSQRIWRREGEAEKKTEENVVKKEAYHPKKKVEDIRSNLEKLAMAVDSGTNTPTDRATNIQAKEVSDSTNLTDVLAGAEKSSEKLNEYIEDAKIKVSKKGEAPISSLASIDPAKNDFKYENLDLMSESGMEEMLAAANEKQKADTAKLEEAKVEKFNRTN